MSKYKTLSTEKSYAKRKIVAIIVVAVIVSEYLSENLAHLNGAVSDHAFGYKMLEILFIIGTILPCIQILVLKPLNDNINYLWNLSSLDQLTQVYNRRYFNHAADLEFRRVERHGQPLSILMLDIDNFKRVNDTYGHACGDMVLTEIAKLIRSRVRSYCTVARYGGEEFIILAPEATTADATLMAEQIRHVVVDSKISIDYDKQVSVTVSIGVATYIPLVDLDLMSVTNRADEALYLAKNYGKNKTVNDIGIEKEYENGNNRRKFKSVVS